MALEDNRANISTSKPETGRLRRFFWVWLVVLLGGGGLWLWNIAQQTNYGTILTPAVIEETKPDSSKSRSLYSGKYFTFSYIEDLKPREMNIPVNYPVLERILFSEDVVGGRKLVVMYQATDGSSQKEEYAAWQIRHTDPDQYFEETIEKRGYSVTLFTKTESVFEVTAFLSHGNKILSVAMTSSRGLDGLREELFQILDSLVFKPE